MLCQEVMAQSKAKSKPVQLGQEKGPLIRPGNGSLQRWQQGGVTVIERRYVEAAVAFLYEAGARNLD